MPERYRNPPLREVIAELRWGLPFPAAQQQPQPVLVIAAPGAHEEFFMRFGMQAGLLGYERAERLVPAGFPSMPQQVIYRFRKKPPEEGTSLYQIGTGIFSINITPPYDSWQEFRPVVENGVRILLEDSDTLRKKHTIRPHQPAIHKCFRQPISEWALHPQLHIGGIRISRRATGSDPK